MLKMNKIILLVVALAVVAGCWCAPDGDTGTVTPFAGEQLMLFGSPYQANPVKAKLLNEYGDLALFVGETETDEAFNAASKRKDDWRVHNSLFLRRRTNGSRDEWRLLLTSGGDWKKAEGMGKWCKDCADDIRSSFYVWRASLSKDGRFVWLVCDRHLCSYNVVCRFDLRENSLCVLTDGDSADEGPDGTIWVLNKKIYLYDKNGEPDGAGWVEEWITPDGKVVRKSEPKRQDDVLDYDEAVLKKKSK